MRILHIDSERGWRGGENQIDLLVKGLAIQGVESFLAARPDSQALARIEPVKDKLIVPLKGSLDLKSARAIAAYCREHRIDIMDAHTSLAHGIGILAKQYGSPAKLVVHRRVDNPLAKGMLGGLKYKSKQIDHYIPISNAIGDMLLQYGIDPANVTTVRSATDPTPYSGLSKQEEKAKLAKAFSLDPELIFIGNASALSSQKGHETFIKAIGAMRKEGLPVHGFIAGSGELQAELDQLRLNMGLDHDVTFLGFVKEIPTLLTALDILAVPSRNEGLGTIILDGIHAGCCVCASHVGGIPEMIIDNETGKLLAPDDVPAWTQTLTALSQDADARRKLAQNAQRHIAQEFSIDNMVAGNLRVYKQLLGKN